MEKLINDDIQKSLGVVKNAIPYLLNQRKRAIFRMKKFQLFYNYNPENFDVMFKQFFANLAKELKENNINVIELQGDYLFIKGNLPSNTMLIPIRNISKYNFSFNEDFENDDQELTLF